MNINEIEDNIIALLRQKNYKDALIEVANQLQSYPTNNFLLRTEIFILFRLNKIDEAKTLADSRFEILKNNIFFIKTYLSILEKLKDKKEIDNLIKIIFSNDSYKDQELFINCINICNRLFDNDYCIELINKSVFLFPQSMKLKEFLKDATNDKSNYNFYKSKYKDYSPEKAIEELENLKIIFKYQNDYNLNLYLAELYKTIDNHKKAMELYKELLTIKDNEFTRKMLGYSYYKINDYENALVYLKDIFLKNPQDYFISTTILNIFKNKNDYKKFKELIEEALSMNPQAKNLYGLLKRAGKWKK